MKNQDKEPRYKNEKKMKYFFLLPLILCMASCSRKTDPSTQQEPTMPVPEFVIRFSLGEPAAKKLSSAEETIRVSVTFDGDGIPLSKVKAAPNRDVMLGKYSFELRKPGDIRVTDAVISQNAYKRLSDKNFHFTINVTSGRRAFKNNVLQGGYAAGRLSDLDRDKPIEIKCDLIERNVSKISN